MVARALLPLLGAVLVALPAAPALAAGPAGPPEGGAGAPSSASGRLDGTQVAVLVETRDGRLALRRERARTAAEAPGLARTWRGRAGVVAADVETPVRAFATGVTVPTADPLQSKQWGLAAVRAPEAWQHGAASTQVVAVVDTGVDLDHPDLAPALVPGRDLVDGDDVADDLNGHGTHVTGIAAGVAGNGLGGAGVAWGAKIMPVRVLDATGSGSTADVASGVLWAVDHGATVVNLSLGGPTRSSVLEKAVAYAVDRGVSVVAAAGNEALAGDPVNYPAAYPGVLAVAAVDRYGVRASFSSTGAHVAVAAPGVGIVSTVPGGGHGTMTGTSMAAPFVAGATALLRSAAPGAGGSVLRTLLTGTAVDVAPTGQDPGTGAGSVDAGAAVAAAVAGGVRTGSTEADLAAAAVDAKHAALGGSAGLLGAPVSALAAVPNGWSRVYERGGLWWSPASGAHEVHGAIVSEYRARGASKGPLGLPMTDERGTPDGVGRYNHFRGGSVYWTSRTGAHEVRGGIRDAWARLGWERGALGYPLTEERGTPDGVGRYNHFSGGSVYWTPRTGAQEVRGAIRETWARLGWERSALGYPTTDERPAPDGVGRFNHFVHGSVYWTPRTGAHEVRGAIREAWARLGWERSALGYPVSDEYAVPGGRASDFERGRIRWDAATGALTVSGR